MLTTLDRAAAAQDSVLANINISGTAGTVKIYTGSAPANLADSATGTLLSTCTIGDVSVSAFADTDTTTLVATGQTNAGWFAQDTNCAATGTAGYFRILDYDNNPVLQGTVGTSGADLNFNTLSIVAGGKLTINSFTSTISGIS
jgi:hypothetical protein